MPLSDYDRALLKRAIQRDRSAFGDFYLRYRPTVYLEILSVVGTSSEAEDLTSETFLRAWNAICRFEDRGFSIEAWLKRIARNLALSSRKRRAHECSSDELERLVDPALLPEQQMESEIDGAAVRQALLGLSDVQRQVLTMRFYEDFTYGQVADVVGKPEGTVRVIQHRALRSLRVLLEKGGLRRQRGVADPAVQGGGE
jgi:RNA polymerase sigma-70 factor (ECF subfamily)